MKLSPRPLADARDQRSDRLRRERLDALTLRSEYPALQLLRIELHFLGSTKTSAPAAQIHELYPPARAFFSFPCPHFDCDSYFALGEIIQNMLARNLKMSKGAFVCSGSRPGPNGGQESCLLQLVYKIGAAYVSA